MGQSLWKDVNVLKLLRERFKPCPLSHLYTGPITKWVLTVTVSDCLFGKTPHPDPLHFHHRKGVSCAVRESNKHFA